MPLRISTLAFVTAFAATVIMGACTSLSPLRAAKTPGQRAYAVYGSFVIAEQAAARVATDPSTPSSVRAAIRSADNQAKPLADALEAALVAYELAVVRGDTPDPVSVQNAAESAQAAVARLEQSTHTGSTSP